MGGYSAKGFISAAGSGGSGPVLKAPRAVDVYFGAPRTTGGRKSPRGESTFLPVGCFAQLSDISEMVFRQTVQLPATAEVGASPEGPWRALRR